MTIGDSPLMESKESLGSNSSMYAGFHTITGILFIFFYIDLVHDGPLCKLSVHNV